MSRRLPGSGIDETRPLPVQMLAFFLPIFVGTVFQQLYNTVDAIIVGKFVSKTALAAVGGSTGTLINLVVGFFVGLAGGATVIIAQGYGARDAKTVSTAVHTGIALALTGGAVLTLLGEVMAGQALTWMGTPTDVYGMARTYLRVYFLGMIPNLVYNIGAGILRAIGDSRRPLQFLAVACGVNIVLDLLLVVWLDLRVVGVAIATVISQTVSAFLVLRCLIRTDAVYRLEPKKIRFNLPMLGRIVRIGIPAGLQSSMYAISNVLIQASVNSFGTDTMAAWTAYAKLDSLYWNSSGAFGTTVATFAGQSYGAGNYGKMKRIVRHGFVMNTVCAVFMSLCMVFGSRYLLLLFLDDPVTISMGVTMCIRIASCYVLFIPIELFSAVCRSAGDTLRPTILTASGICVFRIIWIFTVLKRWHVAELLYLCYPISWGITSILFFVYYFKGNWLHREANRESLPK